MSILLPNGTQRKTEPVTDYLYCGRCGIELPRPPTQLAGRVVQCPCCNNPIQLAEVSELWCMRVSDLLVPTEIANRITTKIGGGR